MHLHALGTATPAARYTKADCLRAFERSDWYARLDARSHLIARSGQENFNRLVADRSKPRQRIIGLAGHQAAREIV